MRTATLKKLYESGCCGTASYATPATAAVVACINVALRIKRPETTRLTLGSTGLRTNLRVRTTSTAQERDTPTSIVLKLILFVAGGDITEMPKIIVGVEVKLILFVAAAGDIITLKTKRQGVAPATAPALRLVNRFRSGEQSTLGGAKKPVAVATAAADRVPKRGIDEAMVTELIGVTKVVRLGPRNVWEWNDVCRPKACSIAVHEECLRHLPRCVCEGRGRILRQWRARVVLGCREENFA